ncbi:hypothetical protein T03_15027 [Trichinella britovi]|uniref:Uncharacterized protein n=1 Tax=Trichinella britovi TaxID=45882 RepID=A0A0V1AHY6_TRIBR|nr:hypothetical protein T03_15027 [Trichinella britovi]
MPLSNTLCFSHHITYDALKLNQGVTTTKFLASD